MELFLSEQRLLYAIITWETLITDSFGYTAYVQNSHACIHKHLPLRPHISRSTYVCNNAASAGGIMALIRNCRERMFLSDNDVQLQKKMP